MVEFCQGCRSKLPPLNGVEENDFAYLCETCQLEEDDLIEQYDEEYEEDYPSW